MNSPTFVDRISAFKLFFERALKSPDDFCTVFPTRKATSKRFIQLCDLKPEDNILEIGCGSGAFSSEILKKVIHPNNFLGIEQDPILTSYLKKQYPNRDFRSGRAENMLHHGVGRFNKIITSLPWSMLSENEVDQLLTAIRQVLDTNGEVYFVLSLHRIGSQKARRLLQRFHEFGFRLERCGVQLFNIPPLALVKAKSLKPILLQGQGAHTKALFENKAYSR